MEPLSELGFMTITYRNKFRDRLAFAAYHLPRNPFFLIITVGFYLFFTFESVLPATRALKTNQPLAVKIIAFLLVESFFAFVLMALLFAIISLTMISRRNKTLFCEKKITLGDEGFFAESPYGRSETRWEIIQKIARTRRHIIMYISQDNAVVIPRRDFETSQQWDEFYNFCKQKTGRK
jgi:YcxB-like protein